MKKPKLKRTPEEQIEYAAQVELLAGGWLTIEGDGENLGKKKAQRDFPNRVETRWRDTWPEVLHDTRLVEAEQSNQ